MVGVKIGGGHRSLQSYVSPAAVAPPQFRPPDWPKWLVPGIELTVRERRARSWQTYTGTVVGVGPNMLVVCTGRYTRAWTRTDWWARQIILVGPDGTEVVPPRPPKLTCLTTAKAAPARGPRARSQKPVATLGPRGLTLNVVASQAMADLGIQRLEIKAQDGLLAIAPAEGDVGYALSVKSKRLKNKLSWGYQVGTAYLAERLVAAGLAYGRYLLVPQDGGWVGEWFEEAQSKQEGR